MIFIIGGNGFVGSGIARYCEAQNKQYYVITRDNYKDFKGKQCDLLINANGNSKKYLANEDPLEEFQLSVSSVRRSLEDFRYKKYVHFSTCDVYNDFENSENNSETANIDVAKQSTYGFHKYLAEQCVIHRAKNYLIIRFGGFVGPGLKKNPIFDILNNGPLWVHPESELQYLHTDTAASIVMDLCDRAEPNQIYNVCGDGLVKLQDVIDKLGSCVEVKPNSPIVKYNININKLKKVLYVPDSRSTVMKFVEEQSTINGGVKN